MTPIFEPISGGYVRLALGGREHRVYVEQAGQGIPLLCLHTAGSDSRQYRGVMNASAVTDHFRVIAFDMPWHGKSSPPEGWQRETYELTPDSYLEAIVGVSKALELDRPVTMGCSIGGRVVLHLALHHPEKFRALIGLQTSAYVAPYYDLSWLHRPDVHGGEVCGAAISGLFSPTAPDNHRWETIWHYMQSGPGVFKGDAQFYKVNGDFRGKLKELQPLKCPLYLLTGEYDYSCSPDDTRDVAAVLSDARFTYMPGLGHFPMSENPDAFVEHLLPVLDAIRKQS